MTEFDLNFQKVGKEGGAIEIDDSVTKYKLLDNNKIVYLKAGNDTLYISDRKGKKEKLHQMLPDLNWIKSKKILCGSNRTTARAHCISRISI